MSNKYEWQENAIKGLRKGQLHIIAAQRQTGKSRFMQMQMQGRAMRIRGPWSDWKKTKFVWPWDRKDSVEGTKIWGKINTRIHKLALNGDGSRIIQFASDVEIFKRTLAGTGESW